MNTELNQSLDKTKEKINLQKISRVIQIYKGKDKPEIVHKTETVHKPDKPEIEKIKEHEKHKKIP